MPIMSFSERVKAAANAERRRRQDATKVKEESIDELIKLGDAQQVVEPIVQHSAQDAPGGARPIAQPLAQLEADLAQLTTAQHNNPIAAQQEAVPGVPQNTSELGAGGQAQNESKAPAALTAQSLSGLVAKKRKRPGESN